MNSKEVTLLILGVGGNVGQGILKALAASTLKCRTIGACIDSSGMGLYACDHAVVSPLATDPRFLEWLDLTCGTYQVQGILSGVESVLKVLATHQRAIERSTGAKILVSPIETLQICTDKLASANWLRDNGLNYPISVDACDKDGVKCLVKQFGHRLFAKPRHGKGSQGILEIKTESDLADVIGRGDYVIQEYLGDPQNEYTASTFTDRDGQVRGCIVFSRQLLEGTTVSARIVEIPIVHAEAIAITQSLKPVGPCNMQLRLHNGRPVCFEINLRYSGTTPIRAQFGFNDVEAGVRHYVLQEAISNLAPATRGVALRYWNELYVDPAVIDSLTQTQSLCNPQKAVIHSESFPRF
jgi:carbamoyl-phosphate synthase large subunit